MNLRSPHFLLALCLCAGMPADAANLYAGGDWAAMASDRNAHRVGDALMVIVYESATATNTASSGSQRGSGFGGQVSAGSSFDQSANLDLQGQSNNSGTVGRSGAMVAQISVKVDKVLSDGDLHVSGAQIMTINGDKTNIRIQGLVRPADILVGNIVLSTRLADATIDYDGSGFTSRSARPGLLTRVLNWLGIP